MNPIMRLYKLCFIIIGFISFSFVEAYSQLKSDETVKLIESLYDSIRYFQKEDIRHSLVFIKQIENVCKDNIIPLCSTDSLEQLKGSTYLNLAKYYQYKNIDSARMYVKKSQSSYIHCNNIKGQMSAAYIRGSLHYSDGIYTKALIDFNEYINYYHEEGNAYKTALGQYKKASCYRRMGYQDSAIVICHKAIIVFENEKENLDLANCYQVVGLVYLELKQFKSANSYFEKALKIYKEANKLKGQASILTCIGNSIYMQGDTLGCIPYYKKAGGLNIKVENNEGIYVNYYNTANAFFQLTQYDSSLVYVNKANRYTKNLGQRHKYMIDYKKGSIYIEKGESNKGIILLEGAYNTSLRLNSYIDARDMAKYINHGYDKLGDYKSALKYSNIYASLKDSVITIESNKKVNEIKTRYETEKKETLISHLETTNSKQRQSIFVGSILLGLISLLTFFIFRFYRRIKGQKSIISKSLKEKDILLREIHHRVKNNLQLISSLLTLQGRSINDETVIQAINESKSRVRSMALIHQDLYNKENLTSVGVKEYLEKLTLELFQTYKISDDRVQLKLEIEDIDLDVDTLVPLGLIINELITNCLKYAFPNDNEGVLTVSLKKSNIQLLLTITDNGIGYDPSKNRKSSFGSTLLSALTAQLNGEMTIVNNNGTIVELVINDYNVNNQK